MAGLVCSDDIGVYGSPFSGMVLLASGLLGRFSLRNRAINSS